MKNLRGQNPRVEKFMEFPLAEGVSLLRNQNRLGSGPRMFRFCCEMDMRVTSRHLGSVQSAKMVFNPKSWDAKASAILDLSIGTQKYQTWCGIKTGHASWIWHPHVAILDFECKRIEEIPDQKHLNGDRVGVLQGIQGARCREVHIYESHVAKSGRKPDINPGFTQERKVKQSSNQSKRRRNETRNNVGFAVYTISAQAPIATLASWHARFLIAALCFRC